ALALMAMGSHGVISVTANIAPAAMARMCNAALAGRWAEALAVNRQLLPLHLKLFVEANPIPVKWAMAERGLIKPVLRMPLTPLSASLQATVRAAMQAAGV
ncbi:MAG: dihydrodipicolinate synthase family protein, partial [Betaproteobacteria bacterium]